ncbi:UNVERIFIED_CONTAM: putative disease resistance protein [Sesamum calycinum]|uniref:Disease resistance protein n=1 Tax=Sesamum calycinum TaxID=2727403 RepID=A0AAW2RA35_9LAMI
MGGLGKTTLANKIYNGNIVQQRFEVRAWICISQQFQPKTVFQRLLKQLLPNESEEQDEDALVRKLYKVQKDKKCLVVLDDVWEVDHWNCLRRAFPIAEAYSKVLLTTRNQNIASAEYIYKLECLSEDEGWELLQKIALSTNYSQELPTTEITLLEEYGREIVKQCGCLPLPISVLGGILRQEKTSIEWEKPCFLYLACFREDEDIEIKDLYLLWMAEGMISLEDRGRGESLQDVAERYLFELASRCMVQVKINEYSICNRFKSCRLHDLMRDLCLLKGKTEGFVDVVDKQIGRDEASSVCKKSRLAIHLDNLDDDHIRNIGKNKNLRSLLFLEKRWKFIERNHMEDVNFGVFKSLKILIFESYKFKDGKLPKGIEHLILLKLLSIKHSNVEELPASILQATLSAVIESAGGGKLKLDGLNDLETLIGFSSSKFETTHLLKLQKLRVLNGIISDDESLSMIVDHILNHQDQFHDTQLFVRKYCNVNREEDGSTLFRRPNGSTREASYVATTSLGERCICRQRDGLPGNWISSAQKSETESVVKFSGVESGERSNAQSLYSRALP